MAMLILKESELTREIWPPKILGNVESLKYWLETWGEKLGYQNDPLLVGLHKY